MTNELETCPLCGDGELHPTEETVFRQFFEDENIPVVLEFSICDGCESEICDNDQVNRNAQRMRNVRNGQL